MYSSRRSHKQPGYSRVNSKWCFLSWKASNIYHTYVDTWQPQCMLPGRKGAKHAAHRHGNLREWSVHGADQPGVEEGDREHPGSEYGRNRKAEDHCCDRV